jgi:hemerythrin
MPLIEWSEKLSVGIESIDLQHRKLIEIINSLDDALGNGNAIEVMDRIFRNLLIYTENHFEYEEKLFRQYGYSAQADHKISHQRLTDQVLTLQARAASGQEPIGDELLAFLKLWLTEHIIKEDMAYASFLIEKGVS